MAATYAQHTCSTHAADLRLSSASGSASRKSPWHAPAALSPARGGSRIVRELSDGPDWLNSCCSSSRDGGHAVDMVWPASERCSERDARSASSVRRASVPCAADSCTADSIGIVVGCRRYLASRAHERGPCAKFGTRDCPGHTLVQSGRAVAHGNNGNRPIGLFVCQQETVRGSREPPLTGGRGTVPVRIKKTPPPQTTVVISVIKCL